MTIPLTGLMAGLIAFTAPSSTTFASGSNQAASSSESGNRVIVFFDGTPSATSTLNASTDETDLSYVRSLDSRMRVYQTSDTLSGSEVSRLNDDLSALPNVAEVRLDSRVQAETLTLSDPYYSRYQDALFGTYGIDAESAWSITKGNGVTVAVVDTGILKNHPDISSNIVGGYDFVGANAPGNYFTANDGDGWDSDASDPGNWGDSAVSGCSASNSNWHGSHVSGTIAAIQNNGIGVTGVAPEAKILPVRALGRCGGYMSDLLAAMRWAAGLSVSGAPSNPNPARIMNLSLGASDTCTGSLATAVNDVTAAGTLIIAAAGNDNANASMTFPANCSNVLTVAAVSDAGARSTFSNYGGVVDIAAPGGEVYPTFTASTAIVSLSNTGTTAPGTDSYAGMAGTSMATPHVTGVAALALAVNPFLSVSELRSVLLDHVKAFAPDPVPAPVSGDSTYPTCNMSNSCGVGIVDAGAAVSYAASTVRPAPPTAVSASRDKTDVTVSWTASASAGSSPIINYVVQANGTDSCTTASSSDTSCKISAMEPGTYTFTVQAVNTQGRSALSAASDSLVVVSAPSVVQNVLVSRTLRSVTVSWSAPQSTGGLTVSYTVSGLPTGDVYTSDTSFTFDSLTLGTTYNFAVTATNSEGASAPVAADPVTVVTPPSSARNVSASRQLRSVTVTWDPPTDSGGLPVSYTVNASADATATTSDTQYTFNDLTPGTIYTFWVTATNSEGASFAEPSAPVGVYTPPSSVQDAQVIATTNAITISWKPPQVTGGQTVMYTIHTGTSGDVTTTATSYTFTSLQPGVGYVFAVVAANTEGAASPVVLAASLQTAPPTTAAPTTSTTLKALPPLTRVGRGTKTYLSRVFAAPKGSTNKWYATGPCYISGTRFIATRSRGTCRLTVISTLKGVKTRRIFSIKVS